MTKLQPFHCERMIAFVNETDLSLHFDCPPPLGYELHDRDGRLVVILRGHTNRPVLVEFTLRSPHYAAIAVASYEERVQESERHRGLLDAARNSISNREAIAALTEARCANLDIDMIEPLVPPNQVVSATVCVLDLEEATQ